MRPRIPFTMEGWPRRAKKYKEFVFISRREYISRRDGLLYKGPCAEDNVRVSLEWLEKHPLPPEPSGYLPEIWRDVKEIKRILEKVFQRKLDK